MAEFEGSETVGTKKEFIIYGAIIAAIALSLHYLLKNTSQTIAATIFLATVIGTLMFWRFRVAIAFIGVVILLATKTMDLPTTLEFMSLDVILFLVGMMVIVALLRQSGFFHWLLAKGLKLSKFEPNRLMIIILVLASVMAALVDEVTSILFTTALVLELCGYFKVSPVKYVISVVLATNIGSSWTVLGNPIGILIALRSGLTFEDFLQWSLPVGIVSLICIIVIVLIWQRGELRQLKAKAEAVLADNKETFLDEWAKIKDENLFRGSVILFIVVIISLALHHQMELSLGLAPNTLLVATSICGAGIAMLWQRQHAREYIRSVDWWTLVFFMFLFAKAGCLQYVGLTDLIADSMLNLTGGGNVALLIVVILLISGFASAAMDNVVVVAALIPVVHALGQQLGTSVLWWALLFGGCYGGNMTMVGSTANIVALGILEEKTEHHMTLKYWIKIGLVGSLVPMAVGIIALLIRS